MIKKTGRSVGLTTDIIPKMRRGYCSRVKMNGLELIQTKKEKIRKTFIKPWKVC
jgi:hypothetical protein